jgi:hypothetical protein
MVKQAARCHFVLDDGDDGSHGGDNGDDGSHEGDDGRTPTN